MKVKQAWPWQRKSFLYLLLAALTVTWTGFSFSITQSIIALIAASLSTVGLVVFVYGLDALLDEGPLAQFFKSSRLWLLVGFGILAVCSSYFFLSPESLLAASFILVNGGFYSYTFEFQNFSFQLKSVIWLKNILIGLGWGFLIFLGAGTINTDPVLIATMFLSLQVMIGSIVRDFDDVAEDQIDSVKTLPLKLGLPKSIVALHFLNFLSLVVLLLAFQFSPEHRNLWGLWILAVAYRAGLIKMLGRHQKDSFFLQQVNISTCGVIFLLRMVDQWIF